MPVKDQDRNVVEAMFTAMQAGSAGEQAMMELFAENSVFTEPFSGQPQTHTGKAAIRKSFQAMNTQEAPDLKLVLDRVDLDGDRVRADWTCTSPVFPEPMKGHDLFVIKDGKIVELEIIVTAMPPMGP